MEYPNLSGDEFKKIVNLVKVIGSVLIIAISFMVSAAIIVSYQDVKSMRDDLRLRSEQASKEIEKMRIIAEENIEKTRLYSNSQIDKTRILAMEEARNTSRNRIEEIFRSGNIEDLVAKTAEQRLKKKLNEIVDRELGRASGEFNSKMDAQIRLNYQQQGIAAGSLIDLLFIDSLRRFSQNIHEKEIAEQIYQAKKYDYINAYKNRVEVKLDTLGKNYITNICQLKKGSLDSLSTDELIYTISNKLLESKFLFIIGELFIVLDKFTDEKIEMFDFNQVKAIRKRYKLILGK